MDNNMDNMGMQKKETKNDYGDVRGIWVVLFILSSIPVSFAAKSWIMLGGICNESNSSRELKTS